MDSTNLASLIVSLIAALGAIAAGRSASKAQVRTAEVQSRTSAETEAYNRARNMDVATITRQDNEIAALREANKIMNQVLMENDDLKAEVARLRRRVRRLEAINPDIDESDEDERENPSEQHSGGP